MIQFDTTFLLKYQIFDAIKTKYQIFDKKLKSASFVLILTDDRKGEKGKNKINIKMFATLERRRGKINKIILLFVIDNKTNLFYNK